MTRHRAGRHRVLRPWVSASLAGLVAKSSSSKPHRRERRLARAIEKAALRRELRSV